MKKQNGFTLVELLAIIIIMGLITTIAVVYVNKIKLDAKKEAYISTLNGLVKSIEEYVASDVSTDFKKDYISVKSITLEATSLDQIKSGFFIIDDGNVILKNVYNGSYCGNGKKGNFIVNEGIC